MHRKASLVLALVLMTVSGYGVMAAWSWPWKAALFPLVIGIPVLVLSAAEAAWVLWGRSESAAERAALQDFQPSRESPQAEVARRSVRAAAWIVGFFAAILLFGFPIAVPLFVFLYLKVQAAEGWVLSLTVTVATWGFFYGLFDRLLHLPFPAGWLIAF
jgi:hypothetical protein